MPTPYKDALLVDAPTGCWPDCETDITAGLRHLTRVSGDATAISGSDGETARSFNGTSQFCKYGSIPWSHATITFSCLIRTPSSLATGTFMNLCPKGTAADGRGLNFYMANTGGANVRKGRSDGGGFVWGAGMGAFVLEPSTKYHLVMVCGPSIFKIYVNNVLRMDDPSSAHGIQYNNGALYYPDPGQFYIAGDKTSAGTPNATDPDTSFGKFDMSYPTIFDGELSLARIAVHYDASGVAVPPPLELSIASTMPVLVGAATLEAALPAPASVTVGISQTQNIPFNISWDAVGAADSYDVRYSKGGGAQQVINAAVVGTSLVFTASQTGTYVFYVRSNIGAGQSAQTASATVTVVKKGKPNFGTITILTAGSGNLSGVHTPGETARGVIVGIVQSLTDGGSVDEIASVTYGGVAMTRVASVAHNHSEDGRLYLYFLGSGLPAGAQTVAVTASGSTADKIAFVMTVSAGTDTFVHTHATLTNGSIQDPGGVLALNGVICFVGVLGFSGRDAVANVTPLTGWTEAAEADQGSSTALIYRYLEVDSVDVTWGWTQALDDAAAIVFAISSYGLAEGGTSSPADITDIVTI